ncbi:hypothetical protein SCP_1102900 [Sparassis crispa]|uniref:Uncharacterized protein n=1 Tax=Sparassis crispa TaxID=139825 RepID=A0A401GZM1_9APHY|nr:hypothetical protein SCP_1102900 [Sparassis crispa]GBE87613.1 hypothetical protein SCP_1102900 [Sparassis crispa]
MHPLRCPPPSASATALHPATTAHLAAPTRAPGSAAGGTPCPASSAQWVETQLQRLRPWKAGLATPSTARTATSVPDRTDRQRRLPVTTGPSQFHTGASTSLLPLQMPAGPLGRPWRLQIDASPSARCGFVLWPSAPPYFGRGTGAVRTGTGAQTR